MDLVFDLGLQVEFFQQTWNLVLNIGWLSSALNDFILDYFLDGPKSVTVLDVFENEFSLLAIRQIHVGSAALHRRVLVVPVHLCF